jgi:hypothetical protein
MKFQHEFSACRDDSFNLADNFFQGNSTGRLLSMALLLPACAMKSARFNFRRTVADL